MSMKTQFLFQNVTLGKEMMHYISKRLERIEKLVDTASVLEVEVDIDKKGKYRVEIMVKGPRKQLYRSEETSESVEASTDTVIDDIERQITEAKDKRTVLARRGARSIKKKLTIDKSARFQMEMNIYF